MRNQGRKKTEQYNRCSKKKAENNNGRGNNHQETAQFSFCHIKEEEKNLIRERTGVQYRKKTHHSEVWRKQRQGNRVQRDAEMGKQNRRGEKEPRAYMHRCSCEHSEFPP
jgi:hypothetical protein